jgi:FdrA protein
MTDKQSPLNREVRVINIGIERFAEDLRSLGVPVVQMDWRPPAGGDKKLIEILDRLTDRS